MLYSEIDVIEARSFMGLLAADGLVPGSVADVLVKPSFKARAGKIIRAANDNPFRIVRPSALGGEAPRVA